MACRRRSIRCGAAGRRTLLLDVRSVRAPFVFAPVCARALASLCTAWPCTVESACGVHCVLWCVWYETSRPVFGDLSLFFLQVQLRLKVCNRQRGGENGPSCKFQPSPHMHTRGDLDQITQNRQSRKKSPRTMSKLVRHGNVKIWSKSEKITQDPVQNPVPRTRPPEPGQVQKSTQDHVHARPARHSPSKRPSRKIRRTPGDGTYRPRPGPDGRHRGVPVVGYAHPSTRRVARPGVSGRGAVPWSNVPGPSRWCESTAWPGLAQVRRWWW